MALAVDYYANKSRQLPRFIYRNLAQALESAASPEARAGVVEAFLAAIQANGTAGDFLKFKWVMPPFLRNVLTPDEQMKVDELLAAMRRRQSRKLSDVYPHCSDEFSLDPAFLAAAFDAAPVPLFGRSTRIFTIGSCFARNIATFLTQAGYTAQNLGQVEDLNSPFSNAVMLEAAVAEEAERAAYLRWWLEVILAGNAPEIVAKVCENEAKRLEGLRQNIAGSEVLTVTLGNTVDFHLAPDSAAPVLGAVRVAPKFLSVGASEDLNTRNALSAIVRKTGARLRLGTHAETLTAVRALHDAIRKINPSAPIVYTLSPVPIESALGVERQSAGGAVEMDCISKSTLRAVIAELLSSAAAGENVHYFPSYEIVRWVGAMLPESNFGRQDAASRHVSADILDAIYGFFLRKHGD